MRIVSMFLLLLAFPVSVFAEGKWTQFTNSNSINSIAEEGDYIWCGTQYGVVRWNKRDGTYVKWNTIGGLPWNDIRSVAVDKNGVKWVASGLGGGNFDGTVWRRFTWPDGSGSNTLINVAVDRNNVKWFGRYSGVTSFDGITWKNYGKADGMAYDSMMDVFVDEYNVKWFGTGANILRFDGQSWINYAIESGPRDTRVFAVAADRNHVLWCGTIGGAFRFDGKTWIGVTPPDSTRNPFVQDIAIDSKNVKWFAMDTLRSYNDSEWQEHPYPNPDLWPKEILIDSEGAVWGGSRSGLFRFDGQTWRTYVTDDLPIINGISHMAIDNDGVFWYDISFGGVASFDGKKGKSYQLSEELYGNSALCLVADQNNVKWFGTQTGVVSFDGSEWRTYTTVDGLAEDRAWSVAVDKDNVKWFGLDSKGVMSYDGKEWKSYPEVEGFDRQPVRNIAVDEDNGKWFCSYFNVIHFDGRAWKTYHRQKELPANAIACIEAGRNGEIWLWSDLGLMRFDGSAWKTYPESKTYISSGVKDITMDRNGVIWIATAGGVFRFNGVSWKQYTWKDGLIHDNIETIVVDDRNVKWFCGSGGMTRFEESGPLFVREAVSPSAFVLLSNHPNPFNPSTTIAFLLSAPEKVSLIVYDITGRKVREIVSGHMTAGTHSAVWDGQDDSGKVVSSGIYIAHLRAGNQTISRRMALVK